MFHGLRVSVHSVGYIRCGPQRDDLHLIWVFLYGLKNEVHRVRLLGLTERMDKLHVSHAVFSEHAEGLYGISAVSLVRSLVYLGVGARDLQRHQCVPGSLIQADVARQHRDSEYIQFRALCGEYQSGSVVRAGIGIYDDLPGLRLRLLFAAEFFCHCGGDAYGSCQQRQGTGFFEVS